MRGAWCVVRWRWWSERMTRCCPLPPLSLSLSLSTDSVLQHWTNQTCWHNTPPPSPAAPDNRDEVEQDPLTPSPQGWGQAATRSPTGNSVIFISIFQRVSCCLDISKRFKLLSGRLAWPGSNKPRFYCLRNKSRFLQNQLNDFF